MKWLPKLLGYDYEIEYKKGSDNIAADALLRVDNQAELASLIATTITSVLLDKIKESWSKDLDLESVIQRLQAGTDKRGKYTWTNGQLRRKGKLVVGNDAELRRQIFGHFYEEPVGGHSGVQVTIKNMSAMPLPIPNKVWSDILIDFVEGLLTLQGKSAIFVVVDRFSKYDHFILIKHPFSASQVAQAFMENVYKLHDLPETI
ncbi:transposon ty3-I gag-pol polyprotein, partial [Tanacetum coccineum]